MKIVFVSSCILLKKKKILITKRPAGKPFSNYWEFPGGKLEKGESFYDAIIRELEEELGIKVKSEDLSIIDNVSYSYELNSIVVMAVFYIRNWTGIVKAKEGQQIQWLTATDLHKVKFLEGSKTILDKINSNLYGFNHG
ncbi:(deoxy)nucleoside triphosphate pyrophosphohydrolase [Pelagibacteraceae bacterium]|nr:(deoxy)nucleoside triphosphate pyrophosphohydrolase [Pelagibacteraceae bacterium]